MISQCCRCLAASSAAAWTIAAVTEKLPEAITGTFLSLARLSMSAKSAAVSPEEPITTATPPASAASTLPRTASWEVKSTRTSTPSSASATAPRTGTSIGSPPQAVPRSTPAAERDTATPSLRSPASSTACATARPAQPVAPATHTLIIWVPLRKQDQATARRPAPGDQQGLLRTDRLHCGQLCRSSVSARLGGLCRRLRRRRARRLVDRGLRRVVVADLVVDPHGDVERPGRRGLGAGAWCRARCRGCDVCRPLTARVA